MRHPRKIELRLSNFSGPGKSIDSSVVEIRSVGSVFRVVRNLSGADNRARRPGALRKCSTQIFDSCARLRPLPRVGVCLRQIVERLCASLTGRSRNTAERRSCIGILSRRGRGDAPVQLGLRVSRIREACERYPVSFVGISILPCFVEFIGPSDRLFSGNRHDRVWLGNHDCGLSAFR